MNKIKIYQFTDPICVWCWGNEPLIRALEYLYDNKIEIKYVMGGLIEDIKSLYELNGLTSSIIARANQLIAENWITASARHGMPVDTEHMSLFSERYPSSFPQNIAYEAAKHINPTKAKLLLRRIREATFTERRRTSQMDVLIELAGEAGFDAAQFINEYTTGTAQSDFMRERARCQRNGVTGFPSYLIKNDTTKIMLGGYQNLSTLHTIIHRLSEGKIKPRRVGPSQANILDFIRRYQRVYPVEIEVAFSLDRPKTDLIIEQLIRTGKITTKPIGNSIQLIINESAQGSIKTRSRNKAKQTPEQHNSASQPNAKREKVAQE